MTPYIRKGDIFWLRLPSALMSQQTDTSVQQGKRPYIVISSNAGCISSPVISVIPCTTKFKQLSVNVPLSYTIHNTPMQALCNQIQTIAKDCLSSEDYAGRITDIDIRNIDEAICKAYSLSASPQNLPLEEKKRHLSLLSAQIKEECLSLIKDITFTEARVSHGKRPHITRTKTDKMRFIEDWQSPLPRDEVAEKYHFSSVAAARASYARWLPDYIESKRRLTDVK